MTAPEARALLTADRNQAFARARMTEEQRKTTPEVDFRPFIIADMPFGTSQFSARETFAHAVQLMQAGAEMVKLEGGVEMAETIHFLTSRGIPVCGHLGLTPQAVNRARAASAGRRRRAR